MGHFGAVCVRLLRALHTPWGGTLRRGSRSPRLGSVGSTAALEQRVLLAAITVNSLADNITAGDGLVTLREAIIAANTNVATDLGQTGAAGLDTIIFGSGLNGTINLTGGEMFISETVTITGNGSTNTAVDAQRNSRIFDITSTAGDVTLEKLTLTGGRTTGLVEHGGAIRSTTTGTLTVNQSTLSRNSTAGHYSRGGAVFSYSGPVTISKSTLSGNSTAGKSARGGGIYSGFGALTVSESEISGNSTKGDNTQGGAICATNGAVTVSQSTFSANYTIGINSDGGAIYAASGVVTVSRSTLSGNSTAGNAADGGAIFAYDGALTVRQSTLTGNFTTGRWADGGAISTASGPQTLIQSTLFGNSTTNYYSKGGAIHSTAGSVTVRQCTLSENSTTGNAAFGGAIYAGTGSVTVSQSTLSDNSTAGINAHGGAIFDFTGAVTVIQSTLSSNSTSGYSADGGAIATQGEVTVSQSTLTGNHAARGRGGAICGRVSHSTITIQNSIVARNTDNGTAPDISEYPESTLTVSHSLIGNNSGMTVLLPATVGSTPDSNGNFIGSGAAPISPHLGPLQNNGGPTKTHALLTGSPAINQGDNAMAVDITQTGNPILTTDQRGVGFARILGGTVDMGAFEAIVPPTATIAVTDTSLNLGETSLVTITFSEAVTGFANADLTIPNGTLSNVVTTNGGVTWTATLTPNASFNDSTNVITLALTGVTGKVVGVGTATSNNYAIDTRIVEAPSLVVTTNSDVVDPYDYLTSLREAVGYANLRAGADTITFGNGSGRGGTNFTDAAVDTILLTGGQLEISEGVALTGHSAANTVINAQHRSRIFEITSTAGDVTLSSLTLKNGRTTGNNASDLDNTFSGGAVRSLSSGTLTISKSTLSGNSTAGTFAHGGAIFTHSGAVTVNQSTLSGNATGGYSASGGAISTYRGDVTVSQTALHGNTTTGFAARGGAIYGHNNTTVMLSQSTLSSNTTAGASANGGAIFVSNGTLTLSQSTLSNNSTTGRISGGGAIFAVSSVVKVSQSTLSGNSTSGQGSDGGAIAEVIGSFIISQSTITGNRTTSVGGGIFSNSPRITIQNSIIAGNTDNGTAPDIRKSDASPTITHSLIGDNSFVFLAPTVGSSPDANGNFVGGAGASAINAQLGPLQNNGGPTWTHALFPGSWAINAGSNTLAVDVTQAGNPALATDQRGAGFPRNYGSSVDMGAVELLSVTATIVFADKSLTVGERSLVTFRFSEPVINFSNDDLIMENGRLSPVTSVDNGLTWTATFTPNALISDRTNVITLNLATLTDQLGRPGVGTVVSGNFEIDQIRPTLLGVVLTDDSLAVGETSLVTFNFSEPVMNFSNADVTVENGTLTNLTSANGGRTWTATFTPNANATDPSNRITVNLTTLTDLLGNAGIAMKGSANYVVDTRRPTLTRVVFTDNRLAAGETSLVTFSFSEAVKNFSNADLTVVNGTLSSVSSVNGGLTWTATYTPNANISVASNVITVNMTTLTDLIGNAGVGIRVWDNFAIDTQRPTLTSLVVADTNLLVGETSLVTFTFNKAVRNFGNVGLTIVNGTLSKLSSTNGGLTWTALFTPTAKINDSTNVITLNLASVTDFSGNTGVGTGTSNNFAINTI